MRNSELMTRLKMAVLSLLLIQVKNCSLKTLPFHAFLYHYPSLLSPWFSVSSRVCRWLTAHNPPLYIIWSVNFYECTRFNYPIQMPDKKIKLRENNYRNTLCHIPPFVMFPPYKVKILNFFLAVVMFPSGFLTTDSRLLKDVWGFCLGIFSSSI